MFFAKVDTTIPTDFKNPVDFLVPGVLSLAVMAAAMVSLGIATGFERRYGVLKRLGSTPLSRGGLLAAKTATVLLFELVEALLIVLTGVALGWHVPRRPRRRASGCCSSARSRSPGSACSWPGRCARRRTSPPPTHCSWCCCSSAGWPTRCRSFPAALQAVAKALPAAALSDTVRSVLSSQPFPTGQLAVLVAWAVLAPLAAARWFRWEE